MSAPGRVGIIPVLVLFSFSIPSYPTYTPQSVPFLDLAADFKQGETHRHDMHCRWVITAGAVMSW